MKSKDNKNTNKNSFIVGKTEIGFTLIDFLALKLLISKKAAKSIINSRSVFVNQKRVWMAKHNLKIRDVVEIATSAGNTPAPKRITHIYEDNHIIIADKKPSMVSNGPDSLETFLRTQTYNENLEAVHRLDKDTSGCLIYAKSHDDFEQMVEVFRANGITKIYHAIVWGKITKKEFRIDQHLDDKKAVTNVRVLDSNESATHIQIRIDTGRTHQIRKHLNLMGHDLVGDRYYGNKSRFDPRLLKVGRQMLHASGIEFVSPFLNKKVRAKAPLPSDFRSTLRLFNLT
ncbi:MAG: RluA family pseudouridine synthase [Kiritimatiellae bacterium]|jgi:23S rRNA pseudouridine1911/1915/1917 synthase|nr:RluA family pseudouridine synthase [Kiritimatiellia bacterium]